MANNIQEIQRKRFQFLQKLYGVTEGSELASVNLWELGAELGFSRPETDRIDEYLTGEGLPRILPSVGLLVLHIKALSK